MKNRKLLILPVIVAIVVVLSVVSVIVIKNNNSEQVKGDELIYDDNGNAYKNVSTDGYEIKVNVNQKNIIEEKQLFNGQSININYHEMCGKNSGRYYMDTMYEMPQFFDVENVKRVVYTVQNCTGICFLKSEQIHSRTQHDPYKEKVIVENKSVTWKAESPEYLYIQIYVNALEDKHSEWYNLNKEQLEDAIIKADIEYTNGEQETKYFGMKVASSYNCTNLYFFELIMQ